MLCGGMTGERVVCESRTRLGLTENAASSREPYLRSLVGFRLLNKSGVNQTSMLFSISNEASKQINHSPLG